jgi:hypothetical protein
MAKRHLRWPLPAPYSAVTVGIKLVGDGQLKLLYQGTGDDLVAAGLATAEAINAARERRQRLDEKQNRVILDPGPEKANSWVYRTISEALNMPGVTMERLCDVFADNRRAREPAKTEAGPAKVSRVMHFKEASKALH